MFGNNVQMLRYSKTGSLHEKMALLYKNCKKITFPRYKENSKHSHRSP